MALSTQPYKGTRDFYPDDMRIQRWMFNECRQAVESFGYQEYDGPMLEPFELYAAKTGEEIVNQQLYSLIDRGERKLAVRPEMTPTMARMVAAKFHELPRPIRWFSIPNLWRYERPQRGRLREHWQLNVDVLGGEPLQADAEILNVALTMLKRFGGEKHIAIRVNNRRLMDHIFTQSLGLTPEVSLQATKAIDGRAKIGEEAYKKWLTDQGINSDQISKLDDFFKASFEEVAKRFPCQGVDELKQLFELMRQSGVSAGGKEDTVIFDATVLRGMNYYTGTVFEIYDKSPENTRAMFGGGRYDNLLGLFGNFKLSGVGFGMGDVTLRNFLETHALLPKIDSNVDVFVSLPAENLRQVSEEVAGSLRAAGFKVVTPLGVDGFGAQLKLATKHGAKFVVLFGESELKEGKVLVKNLAKGEQTVSMIADLPQTIRNLK